jgi:hypothetical protein
MNDRELRGYEMVLRVRDFSAEHAESFPKAATGGKLFATVSEAADELAGHVAAQVSGGTSARQGTATKEMARADLQESLEMIRRTARSMSHTTPGLDSKFRIPRTMTDQALLGTARAFASDVTPLKSSFLAFAMPATFLDDLNAQIAEFETALTNRNVGKEHRSSATAGIGDALERALIAVRQLDAIVRNTFHDDPVNLAAWESVRHVKRSPGKKAATPKPSPPAP